MPLPVRVLKRDTPQEIIFYGPEGVHDLRVCNSYPSKVRTPSQHRAWLLGHARPQLIVVAACGCVRVVVCGLVAAPWQVNNTAYYKSAGGMAILALRPVWRARGVCECELCM